MGVFTDTTISDGNIHDNVTEYAGAIALFSGSLTMSGGTIQNNHNNMKYSGEAGAMILGSVKMNCSPKVGLVNLVLSFGECFYAVEFEDYI